MVGNDRISSSESDEVSFSDFWSVLQKRWRLILGSFVILIVLGVLLTSQMPTTYKSKTTFYLLPTSYGETSSLGFMTSKVLYDWILEVLKSRQATVSVIEKFDLNNHFKSKGLQHSIATLENNTTIREIQGFIISIEVEDTDPQMAADIANYYVDYLNQYMVQLKLEMRSSQTQRFAQYLIDNKKMLAQTERELEEFRMKNKGISSNGILEEMIESLAQIQGWIIFENFRFQMSSDMTDSQILKLLLFDSNISNLKKLGMFEFEVQGNTLSLTHNSLLGRGFDQKVIMHYIRLLRNLKVQETVNALLSNLIDKGKNQFILENSSDLQVLDLAILASEESKPNGTVNVVIAGIFGVLLGGFLSFFLEGLEKGFRLQRQKMGKKIFDIQ